MAISLNKNMVHRTGRVMNPCKDGLVDLTCDGYIDFDGERVPCAIGYTIYASDEYGDHIEATHAFVSDCITESGTNFNAETYELY